jgi:hypothetical protein
MRNTLIIPMQSHPDHAFGRLSGYTDAYWLFAEKMKKEGRGALVYYSHEKCYGETTLKACSDGYIWHDGGLCWYFEIEREGTFMDQSMSNLEKTKWSQYIPPFRRYNYHRKWFLLKNMRKIKEEKIIKGKKARGGLALNTHNFWREIEGFDKRIHSSMFRSSSGAPWAVRTSIQPPQQSDVETLKDPLNDLVHNAIIKRYGIDEQAIEEIFLLKILWNGFDNKPVNKIWQQEGFTDKRERVRYRFDAAFGLEDGSLYAVEFKRGTDDDAPLQLKNYIDKSTILKDDKAIPIPMIVCARRTKELEKEMRRLFPGEKWRIVEFKPRILFEEAP